MSPLLLLSTQARNILPTTPSLSITWSRKHVGASAVVDDHLDAVYFMISQLTPPLFSSRNLAHLSLLKLLPRSPIPQAFHTDAAASAVVSKYPISRKHFLFLVLHRRLYRRCQLRGPVSEGLLTFGLLTSYFFWWRFVLVTVGNASLHNLVVYDTVENSWVANWTPRLFYEKYTIFWFEFDLCG